MQTSSPPDVPRGVEQVSMLFWKRCGPSNRRQTVPPSPIMSR